MHPSHWSIGAGDLGVRQATSREEDTDGKTYIHRQSLDRPVTSMAGKHLGQLGISGQNTTYTVEAVAGGIEARPVEAENTEMFN